jgi:hypothetical protein
VVNVSSLMLKDEVVYVCRLEVIGCDVDED